MKLNVTKLAAVLVLALCPFASASDQPPNVVLIFADDLGYGDLGCYGATKVQTPNIDRLAAEGRRFSDAHSVSAVCTPSRYALITGEYPVRANGGRGVWGPAPVTSGLLVDTNKTTIADIFKSSGYDTAAFGKWHLGFGDEKNDWQVPLSPGPNDLGFDHYFGMPVVNSAPPYVFVENDRIVGGDPDDPLVFVGRNAKEVTPLTPIPPEAAQRSPNQFGGAKKAHELFNDYKVGTTIAEKSVEWINQRDDKPFFLYLATTNIHHPFTPAKRFQGTSQCGLYGDFIHELDWIVGEVMTCLEEKGISDNTLVIFTSDNGGMFNRGGQAAFKAGHRQNGDLLGFKFGVWEGGHRVPMIVRWPGKVKAGSISNQVIGNVDMLATFAAVTGHDLDKTEKVDSVNMLPAFVDEPAHQLRDHLVLAPHKGTHLSIRKGKWMFIPARGSGGFGGKKPGDHTFAGPGAVSFVGSVNSDIEDGKIRKDAPRSQLYNLEQDVNQKRNVYAEHPDVVKELTAILAGYKPKPGPAKGKGKGKGNPAKKTSAGASTRSASFDFESGMLHPWKVVEGEFGHPIGSRDQFFANKGQYNKQGKYYLTTLEGSADAEKGSDPQTGVIVSPQFIPEAGVMTFRVGGGSGNGTYVALCTTDGTELKQARGIRDQVMQKVSWDLTPYAGQKLHLKVVDRAIGGWGHITADDFQFDAEVLNEYAVSDTGLGIRQNSKPKVTATDSTANQSQYAKTSDEARSPAASRATGVKPNFVVIFTDDQGFADLSCFGGTHVSTPRIDQMAAEGAKLTHFYVAAPVCTPSRAALMTGCYPKRIDMAVGSNFGVLLAGDTKGLNPQEITIAEVLKTAGYRTGMFGKWHLGDQPEFLPTEQGFDEYFGIPFSHDIHPYHPRQNHYKFPSLPLLDQDVVVEVDPDANLLTKRITDRAVQFIKDSKDQPFFMYVPHPIPHRPLHVSEQFMKDVAPQLRAKLAAEPEGTVDYKNRDKLFRQAISEIDWSVGQILDTLKSQGLDENTVVIFTSDNGPAVGKAVPLRGRKGQTYEGGMREPTVIRWPGKIPAGKVNEEIMTTMDLLPTFAKLAGATVPSDRKIDGKDIWPTLTKKASTPHEAFFYHRGNSLTAVRSGKWKLHLKDGRPSQLCDLESDIGEKRNLIKSHPEVVARLTKHGKEFQKDIAENNRPAAFVENPRPLALSSN